MRRRVVNPSIGLRIISERYTVQTCKSSNFESHEKVTTLEFGAVEFSQIGHHTKAHART